MTVLLNELAEAEKEQSAKRALKKSQQAQPGQDEKTAGAGTSITAFLQDFQPQPVDASVKMRDLVIDLTH